MSVSRASTTSHEALTDRLIHVTRAQAAPILDGLLDDACWSECEPARGFFDVARGVSPTQATEVRVCFDDERLYVAFECYEERMDAVSAAVTQRDASGMFEVDDSVAVLLDTYHQVDRRGRVGGYAEVDRDFQINGGRVDEIDVAVFGARYEGIDGGDSYWYVVVVVSTVFPNKLNLTVRGERTHDEVDYPDYPASTTGSVQLTTNLGAWTGYIVGIGFGDYDNSTYYSADAVACLQPHERVTIDAGASGVARRDYEDVDWVVERLRSDWLISRTSFVRLIAQGVQLRWGMEGGDYRSQEYDLNVLYGWEFRPGSMFYLAYNQPVVRQDGVNEYLDPVIVAKATYLLSL